LGVVALELLDVANGRAAEGVDRLVGIAHHAQLAGGQVRGIHPDEFLDQLVLRMIGVLVLVHQDVPEPAPIVLGDIAEQLEHGYGARDQVVEVEGIGRGQAPLVVSIGLGQGALGMIGCPRGIALMVDELVLEVGDLGEEAAWVVPLRIEVEVAQDHGHQACRIRLVVDGEVGRNPEPTSLTAQDAYAGAVEGRDPHDARPAADQLGYPLLHLAGCLVREGDGEDLPGLGIPGCQQVSDPARQHASLARSGPGHDEQGRTAVLHRLALLLIQVADQGQGALGASPAGPGRRTHGLVPVTGASYAGPCGQQAPRGSCAPVLPGWVGGNRPPAVRWSATAARRASARQPSSRRW